MDEKIAKLSKLIVDYSVDVKPGERVFIQYCSTECHPLVKQLIKDIVAKGGVPFTKYIDAEISALLFELSDDARIDTLVKERKFEVETFDSRIFIDYNTNDYQDQDINPLVLGKFGELAKEYNDIRTNDRKWVLLNYPSPLDAYKSGLKTEKYRDFAFKVVTDVDYQKMCEDLQPLKNLMEQTDLVHMVGPGTDITFSIKGIPAVPCCGNLNLPDGEVYTAPIKDSIHGTITFNTPCSYQGNVFHDVSLTYENGKMIDCKCSGDNDKLNAIFDTDPGARYVGEFSFGLNPMITNPMGDILFDEKIIGSIHFTPGKCYKDANNGNESSIHWDMIWIQREEYGGGEVYFDGKLIRKDGIFVLAELSALNYHLK